MDLDGYNLLPSNSPVSMIWKWEFCALSEVHFISQLP